MDTPSTREETMTRHFTILLTTAALTTLPLVAAVPSHAATSPSPRSTYETPVIRVDVIGKGRPMLLIPGLTCAGDVWRETVAHVAGRYECHVVTIGGFA